MSSDSDPFCGESGVLPVSHNIPTLDHEIMKIIILFS